MITKYHDKDDNENEKNDFYLFHDDILLIIDWNLWEFL